MDGKTRDHRRGIESGCDRDVLGYMIMLDRDLRNIIIAIVMHS